jgi:hypothetical protein
LQCCVGIFLATSNSLNPKRFIHIPYKSDHTAKHGGGHFRTAMINMSCTKNKYNFSIQLTDSIPIEGKSNSQQENCISTQLANAS